MTLSAEPRNTPRWANHTNGGVERVEAIFSFPTEHTTLHNYRHADQQSILDNGTRAISERRVLRGA